MCRLMLFFYLVLGAVMPALAFQATQEINSELKGLNKKRGKEYLKKINELVKKKKSAFNKNNIEGREAEYMYWATLEQGLLLMDWKTLSDSKKCVSLENTLLHNFALNERSEAPVAVQDLFLILDSFCRAK